MTVAARMSQADMERSLKAAVKAAGGERARVLFRLDKREIEVIIGGDAQDSPAPAEWTDEDV